MQLLCATALKIFVFEKNKIEVFYVSDERNHCS